MEVKRLQVETKQQMHFVSTCLLSFASLSSLGVRCCSFNVNMRGKARARECLGRGRRVGLIRDCCSRNGTTCAELCTDPRRSNPRCDQRRWRRTAMIRISKRLSVLRGRRVGIITLSKRRFINRSTIYTKALKSITESDRNEIGPLRFCH